VNLRPDYHYWTVQENLFFMFIGVADFKQELANLFQEFASTGRVITEQDIHDFSAQLHERKRRRLNNAPSHFCS